MQGNGIGGIDFTAIYDYAEFTPGFVVDDLDGGAWMFVKAAAALTANLAYKILVGGNVGSGTAAEDAVDDNSSNFVGGFGICWPQQAFASGDYGFVRLSGTIEASVATGLSAGAKLYTSTTAGVLDGTRSAHYDIVGPAILVDATTGGAAVCTIKVARREPFVGSSALS